MPVGVTSPSANETRYALRNMGLVHRPLKAHWGSRSVVIQKGSGCPSSQTPATFTSTFYRSPKGKTSSPGTKDSCSCPELRVFG